jgi:hypothetical protein
MDIVIFGGRESQLPPDWADETYLAILGGATLDASAGAADEARLTFVGVLGGAKLRVPKGSRIHMSGFSFLGGRSVKVQPGDGPKIHVRAFTLLGGLEVTDREE